MTPEQESKCAKIIHTAAIGAGAGNAVPVPGLGIAADTVALTGMAIGLAAVFGGEMTHEAAKAAAISALKNVALKAPLRTIAKELSKLVPGLGQVVAPAASFGLVEAAGWALAKDLERKYS